MLPAIADIRQIVTEAGQLALLHYGKVTGTVKADLSIASAADAAVEDCLRSSLPALAPHYGYIGEETAESRPPAAGETRAWVVALDGSRAFVARMPLLASSRVLDGRRPADCRSSGKPGHARTLWAAEDGPAFCNPEMVAVLRQRITPTGN